MAAAISSSASERVKDAAFWRATFAFKSRPNFSTNFVRGLSTKVRDLNAVTMQLNPRKLLKIKKRQSGI
jgi:hypothetical protein